MFVLLLQKSEMTSQSQVSPQIRAHMWHLTNYLSMTVKNNLEQHRIHSMLIRNCENTLHVPEYCQDKSTFTKLTPPPHPSKNAAKIKPRIARHF